MQVWETLGEKCVCETLLMKVYWHIGSQLYDLEALRGSDSEILKLSLRGSGGTWVSRKRLTASASWPLSNFWANSPFVLPKNEILAESEFAASTITKLIPITFSTSGASVAYNVNPVADQFQRAFQTSTFCNRLYSFFNKRWFFDQVLNDFLVRLFLRFGYEISFEALDKGAIEILGPYGISYTFRRLAERISQLQSGFVVRRVRYDPWPSAWWGRLLRCG